MHTGDTAFGQLARLASGGKWFAYQETSSQTGDRWLPSGLDHNGDQPSSTSGVLGAPRWLVWAARWAKMSDVATTSPHSSKDGKQTLLNDSSDNQVRYQGRDHGLVSWYGDDDPDNPQNWSSVEKTFVAGLICLYTFAVYLGSAIYTPSVEGVMRQFNVSYAAANLGLALFVFGYGSGAMIFSPLSEIPSVGRNWIYMITFVLYIAFSIGSAVAPNYGALITLRFLAGFVGSPALATGGATLQDIFDFGKLPYGIALWVAAASMGPALGPVMGGFAAAAKSWRWPLWIEVWLCAPVLVIMFFCLPETSAPNILRRRAQRIRAASKSFESLRCQAELEQDKMSVKAVVVEALIRPIQISILDPGTGFVNLYVSLIYAIYYSFFESFALIYPVTYGFSLGLTGLTFVSVVVTTGLGAAGYMYYVYHYVEPKIRETGRMPSIDSRLIPAIPASILMPIGLFLFGWTSRESIHWIVGLIGVGIYSLGFYIVLQCVLLYVPLTYPKYSASLLAANDFCRSSLAAGFVMSGRPMFVQLGIGGGVSLLAGLTCVCIPALLLLYRYGPLLRSKSKFAVEESDLDFAQAKTEPSASA